MAKQLYVVLLVSVVLSGSAFAQISGTAGASLANPYGAVTLPGITTPSGVAAGSNVPPGGHFGYWRVRRRSFSAAGYPCVAITGTIGVKWLGGNGRNRGLEYRPGLAVVPAFGSFGVSAISDRHQPFLRALAHSRYIRRNGRLKIACCSGVSA